MWWPIGTKVVLRNLTKGSQYNGKNAIVQTNVMNGRQNVLILDTNKVVAIKPENLGVISERGDIVGFDSILASEEFERFVNAAYGPLRPDQLQLRTSLVEAIRKGDCQATAALSLQTGKLLPFHLTYEQSGILTSVLDFLKRCEDETLDGVLTVVNGDLNTPTPWIEILLRSVESELSCTLQIAENIGPLVSCMCADTKRLFFKSNKHWNEGIRSFVSLITHMISTSINSTDKRVVNTLLSSHDGLLECIIQWVHWKEYRPDIAKIISAEECGLIYDLARECTVQLMKDALRNGRDRLAAIGSTPLVNKEYDPNCTTSFVARLTVGLIRIKFFRIATPTTSSAINTTTDTTTTTTRYFSSSR